MKKGTERMTCSAQGKKTMNVQAIAQAPLTVIITRPCTRCGLELTDPASVEAGIGPICRGYANQILAKEVPSRWSDTDLFNFTFLSTESFPEEAQARFAKVFTKICQSKGMNQGEGQAVKGEDLRAVARELVYLASVAPTNAMYEALIGAIRGIGYVQYAAFVSGDSASGNATLSLENGKVFLAGVRNSMGQNALYQIGACREYSAKRWYTSLNNAAEFVRVASIYWPFVKGAQEVLDALSPAPTLALVPNEAHAEPEEEAPQAPTEATATEPAQETHPAEATPEEAPKEVPTETTQEAPALSPEIAPVAPATPAEEAPAPSEAETNENQITINHGEFLTHHNVIKRTEKALQVESDCPFSKKITSWIPNSWLKETPIKNTYKLIPWALDKLTKYQEAALGIREL
jgi:Family of unknown function (DUF6011)